MYSSSYFSLRRIRTWAHRDLFSALGIRRRTLAAALVARVTANHVEVIAYFTAASRYYLLTNQADIFVAITIKKPLFGDEFQEKFTIDITPVARLKRETIWDRVNLFRAEAVQTSSSGRARKHLPGSYRPHRTQHTARYRSAAPPPATKCWVLIQSSG